MGNNIRADKLVLRMYYPPYFLLKCTSLSMLATVSYAAFCCKLVFAIILFFIVIINTSFTAFCYLLAVADEIAHSQKNRLLFSH